jgi:hypothetical protein
MDPDGAAVPRRAGWLAIGAGAAFFATTAYLLAVLPAVGLDLDMFDHPERLLPWVDSHVRWYQALWLLYFLSQALLLTVPWLVGDHVGAKATGILGTVAVSGALTGLAVIYAASPVTAAAFQDPATDRGSVLALHSALADIGKDLRLFSEVLLGVWLLLAGRQLRAATGRRGWWALSALGGWTLVVAAWKLLDPLMPLEDWLGFLLGSGYVALGVGLLRAGRR